MTKEDLETWSKEELVEHILRWEKMIKENDEFEKKLAKIIRTKGSNAEIFKKVEDMSQEITRQEKIIAEQEEQLSKMGRPKRENTSKGKDIVENIMLMKRQGMTDREIMGVLDIPHATYYRYKNLIRINGNEDVFLSAEINERLEKIECKIFQSAKYGSNYRVKDFYGYNNYFNTRKQVEDWLRKAEKQYKEKKANEQQRENEYKEKMEKIENLVRYPKYGEWVTEWIKNNVTEDEEKEYFEYETEFYDAWCDKYYELNKDYYNEYSDQLTDIIGDADETYMDLFEIGLKELNIELDEY